MIKNNIFLILVFLILASGCKKTSESGSSSNSVSSVTIDTGTTGIFEITNSDLVSSTSKLPAGLLDWLTATSISSSLGTGWRLPTSQEWKILIKFKSQIPSLKDAYWTSSKSGTEEAYVLVVADGNSGLTGINSFNRARAIRKK
jgi:hypothetical protein